MLTPRIFTVREAEATLPLVAPVVGDLLAAYPRWKAAVARYELLAAASHDTETPDLREAREAVTDLAERINGYLVELEQVGCVFKGFEAGLVDFYALKEDRLIFLCWRQGEDRITHWHEIEAGFSGRQPIDTAMLTETVIG